MHFQRIKSSRLLLCRYVAGCQTKINFYLYKKKSLYYNGSEAVRRKQQTSKNGYGAILVQCYFYLFKYRIFSYYRKIRHLDCQKNFFTT